MLQLSCTSQHHQRFGDHTLLEVARRNHLLPAIPLLQHKPHDRQCQRSMCDLGRTPTSSNCSDVRKFKGLGPPSAYLASLQALPAGVHVSSERHGDAASANSSVPQDASRPLVFHPELASRIPTPPPNAIATGMMMPPAPSFGGANNIDQVNSSGTQSVSSRDVETREGDDAASTSSASSQYMNHQATVDDVMEVAMTLSKLGNARTTGPIPRFR